MTAGRLPRSRCPGATRAGTARLRTGGSGGGRKSEPLLMPRFHASTHIETAASVRQVRRNRNRPGPNVRFLKGAQGDRERKKTM